MDIRWERTDDRTIKRRNHQQRRTSPMKQGYNATQRGANNMPLATSSKENQYEWNDSCASYAQTQSESGKHSIDKSRSAKKKHKRTASLTDLRPEDKKKVANLIQELANLGSQKEDVENKLKKERSDFEAAIKQLVADQKNLLSERMKVQQELTQCQNMLGQLQEAVLHRDPPSTSTSAKDVSQTMHSLDVKPSVLEQYIMQHSTTVNSTMDALDTASDIGSIDTDVVRNPRISSTALSQKTMSRITKSPGAGERSNNSRSRSTLKEESAQSASQHQSTLDYTKKDAILEERAKLLEEQKFLRQKLMEQEGLLRAAQTRLQSQGQRGYRGDVVALSDRQQMPPLTHSPRDGSGEQILRKDYSIGIQVDSPEKPLGVTFTKDCSVQAELANKYYVGNRLVPSPSQISKHNSIDETIQRTTKLLQSARKIIDEAKSPHRYSVIDQSLREEITPQRGETVTPRSTHLTPPRATPRKTPRELFDSDATLASELNDESFMGERKERSVRDDADSTELQVLGDIFYVR